MACKSEKNYLFANARIHAMEGKLLSRDKYERLLETSDTAGLLRALSEVGFGKPADAQEAEMLFESVLLAAYRDVSEMLPDTPVFKAMRYPYDCHNIKLALKTEKRPDFSYGELSSPLSSVPTEVILRSVSARDYSALPPKMAQAAPAALEAYDKTGDPQYIDFLLDGACFADMKAVAEAAGSPEFTRYLAVRADSANILSALRVLRMGREYPYFRLAFVPGGTLDAAFFSAMNEGEEALTASLMRTVYASAFSGEETSFSAVSGRLDAVLQKELSAMAPSAFTAGAAIGYLSACERQMRNLRVLFAAKQAHEEARLTRARLSL